MSELLDIQGLKVDLPVEGGTLHAVRNVSLTVDRGETLCLVGESGCGKSLTASAIMGLLPRTAKRTASRLAFDGQDIAHLSSRGLADLRGSRMAMVFQDPLTALNPSFTIGDQLTEGLMRHKGVSKRHALERAEFLLNKVGIAPPARASPNIPTSCPAGCASVMIAMALMCGPDLVIADEPTTALDVTVQAQILKLLVDLQQEFGMALILITHDLGVVARVADRVALMYAGEIVESGPVASIFARPVHPYTNALLACLPTPGITRPGDRLGAIPGTVPSLTGEVRGCAFHTRCSKALPACAETAFGLCPVETDPESLLGTDLPMTGASPIHLYRCIHPAAELAAP